MGRFQKDKTELFGEAPGTMVFIGEQQVSEPVLRKIRFGPNHYSELTPNRDGSSEPPADLPQGEKFVTWLDVTGLHDVEFLQQIAATHQISSGAMADIVNTSIGPRFEEQEDQLFISLKMLQFDPKSENITTEHISIVVKEGLVITFQEKSGDVFDPIRERIKKKKGKVKQMRADYLAFALIDVMIDHYSIAVQAFGNKIEDLEPVILEKPDSRLLQTINSYKIELNFLRKNIRPVKELTLMFAKSESELINKSVRPFLKDLVTNATEAIEVVETYRILLSDFLDVYHTSVSYKMNDIMKVLTIFSAVFIPLTFMAGIYGMNFDYIPELKHPNGYFILLGAMALVGLGMLFFFRNKKWL